MKNRKTKEIKLSTIMFSIVIFVVVCYGAKKCYKYFNTKENSNIMQKAIIETTLGENNCKFEQNELSNSIVIQKYNGNAEKVVIEKNIGEKEVDAIESNAFLESSNLETILVDKEIAETLSEIDGFEKSGEVDNYVEYKTTRNYNLAYQKYMGLSEEQRSKVQAIPRRYDVPMSELQSSNYRNLYYSSDEDIIPESFDLRDKIQIQVENQGFTGTCYAYASLESVETNLALRQNDYQDLSDVHLAALTYGSGGQFIGAEDAYYTERQGPVYERELSIEDLENAVGEEDNPLGIIYDYLCVDDLSRLTEEYMKKVNEALEEIRPLTAKKYVSETVKFPSAVDIDDKEELQELQKIIKKHIMNYGSLYASIDSNEIYGGSYTTLNSNEAACPNHAISIIGWDDNFSKENFFDVPENDGAYLAMSSWGENWGDKGCFWISYEDFWVTNDINGVISVEDISEGININKLLIKNLNSNEEVSKITKENANYEVKIDVSISDIVEGQSDFIVNITSPSGELINDTIDILGTKLTGKNANIVLNFNVLEFEIGMYKINIEYGESTITRFLYVNPNVFDYIINEDETLTLTGYYGNESNLEIPTEFLGYQVTGIGDYAFIYNKFDTLTIYENIVEIGEVFASSGTIILGYTNTPIEQYAKENGYNFIDLNGEGIIGNEKWEYKFGENKLYIYGDTQTLEWYSFKDIIYEVEICEPVTTLIEWEFSDCKNLEKVTLPNTITNMGIGVFHGCEKLKEINLPEGITKLPEIMFYRCKNLETIKLPNNLTEIGNNAFFDCRSLSIVEFNDSLKAIGNGAFGNCAALSNMELPSSLENIGLEAFEKCINLKVIQLPNGLENIGDRAFQGCSGIENITIPNQVRNVGKYVFAECISLQNVVIDAEVQEIQEGAFSDCRNLEQVQLTNGIKKLGTGAFKDCYTLQVIDLPETLEELGDEVFENCRMFDIIRIKDGVQKIGKDAFAGCINIKEVELPEVLEELASGTFQFCSGIEQVVLPSSLKIIGDNAFYWCENLKKVETPNTLEEIGANAFEGCHSLENIELPNGLKRIGENAYSECYWAKELKVPETVENIGKRAFSSCKSFKSIVIPENIENIEGAILENSFLVIDVDFEENDEVELELPDILKRALNVGDIFYAGGEIILSEGDAELDLINKKITLHKSDLEEEKEVIIHINDGILKDLRILYYMEDNGNSSEKEIDYIYISNPPDKIEYTEGERFDITGMIVKVVYTDKTEEEITDYSYTPNGPLTILDDKIVIKYTQNEIKKETEQVITVNKVTDEKKLDRIYILKAPNKTEYTEGEKFDVTGMKVMAVYTDEEEVEITDYTYMPNRELTLSDNKIMVKYTINGISKETEQQITVKKSLQDNTEDKNTNKNQINADEDNTKANSILPKTGVKKIVIITISVSCIVSVWLFIRLRKMKDFK